MKTFKPKLRILQHIDRGKIVFIIQKKYFLFGWCSVSYTYDSYENVLANIRLYDGSIPSRVVWMSKTK